MDRFEYMVEGLKAETRIPKQVQSRFDETLSSLPEQKWTGRKIVRWRRVRQFAASAAAAAAVFSGACIVNPTFASSVPVIGHVFEELGHSLGFSGNYEGYAQPIAQEGGPDAQALLGESETAAAEQGSDGSQTVSSVSSSGITVSLSEYYCNDATLSLALVLTGEEPFPDTATDMEGRPILSLYNPHVSVNGTDYVMGGESYLVGKWVDEKTFAGILRCPKQELVRTAEDGQMEEILEQFPDDFKVALSFEKVVGDKAAWTEPEMPEDLQEGLIQGLSKIGIQVENYQAAMEETGTPYGYTKEQQAVIDELVHTMYTEYSQRYPKVGQYPSEYHEWWTDGTWELSFQAQKNDRDTFVKEINDVDENGLGLVRVTRTPFEIQIEAGQGRDLFVTATDADGDMLPYGDGGSAYTFAIQDRDVSKIDVYICDYLQYMDELKGYYWADDYQEKRKEKTFSQYLDEKALYHKEIRFEE